MAENDYFPKWRRACRLVKNGASAEDVAVRAEKFLTRALRQCHGLPCLPSLTILLGAVDAGQVTPAAALKDIDLIERSFGAGRPTKIAGQVARRTIVMLEQGERLGAAPAQLIAERVLWEIVHRQLFAPVNAQLVGTRFGDMGQAEAFEAECKRVLEPGLKEIAKRLLRNPSADGLRAPARKRQSRAGTPDLLHESVLV